MARAAVAALALVAAVGAAAPASPVRVGVLLPLSGPGDLGLRGALEWAREVVNRAGGVAGRPLALDYADLARAPVDEAAEGFLADPAIAAVIGPDTSEGVFAVADRFIGAHKVLVSPSASAANILSAFGGREYVWRTVESDVAQVETMLAHAGSQGARRVALWTDFTPYGATFFDWFGFLARELGLEVTAVVRRPPAAADCAPSLAEAVTGQPDVLFVATTSIDDVTCLQRAAATLRPATRLFFSDGARYPGLPSRLGAAGEGMAGTAFGPDPATGFDEVYRARFGAPPPAFAAQAYDALLLVAYGLARSGGRGGPALAGAMRTAVDGRGRRTGWDAAGVAEAMRRLGAGEQPDVSGATGGLTFDRDLFTDPTESTFRLWRIHDGAYETTGFYSNAGAPRVSSRRSAVRMLASARLAEPLSGGVEPVAVPERHGVWAVIAALSSGWENYRHQADALAIYHRLRSAGVPDARIVLVLADDVTTDPRNADRTIRNVADGPDLRAFAEVDAHLGALAPADLLAILAGAQTDGAPAQLAAGPHDDVLVYLVGHGGRRGLYVGAADATGAGAGGFIGAAELRGAIADRWAAGGYRRMLILVEACDAGVLGEGLDVPNALLIASAGAAESSFSANWDPAAQLWRADAFSWAVARGLGEDADRSIADLYAWLYGRVAGSHVSVYNHERFGDAGAIAVRDFVAR